MHFLDLLSPKEPNSWTLYTYIHTVVSVPKHLA